MPCATLGPSSRNPKHGLCRAPNHRALPALQVDHPWLSVFGTALALPTRYTKHRERQTSDCRASFASQPDHSRPAVGGTSLWFPTQYAERGFYVTLTCRTSLAFHIDHPRLFVFPAARGLGTRLTICALLIAADRDAPFPEDVGHSRLTVPCTPFWPCTRYTERGLCRAPTSVAMPLSQVDHPGHTVVGTSLELPVWTAERGPRCTAESRTHKTPFVFFCNHERAFPWWRARTRWPLHVPRVSLVSSPR